MQKKTDKGRGNDPLLFLPGMPLQEQNQHPQLLPHPQPQPLLLPYPPQRRSRTRMIQQLSPFPHPPQLLPYPLFPQQHIRMMIQRMQLQEEPPPKRLVPHPQLLLHPQPQSLPHPHPLLHPQSLLHPQFVAAKSLIIKSSGFLSTVHFM